MPDERWASQPGWHPPACTCVACNNRRRENQLTSLPKPKPHEAPGPGHEWRQCQTCNTTGWIIGRWISGAPGGRLTRCPRCFKRGWVLAETEQDRRVRYESGLEAQANDLLIESYGAEPYIPFKSNTTGKGSGPAN